MYSKHYVSRLLAAISAVVIAIATVTPLPRQAELVSRYPFWCLACGDFGVVDVALNLFLFVPLGAGLALAGVSLPTAAAAGASLSLGIELFQQLVPGRDPSVSDLLANAVGAALGALAAARWRFMAYPSPRAATFLAFGTAAAWLVQTAITAAAMQPALTSARYWGQRAPALGQFERFEGTVLDAAVGPAPLPSSRLPDAPRVRALLEAGSSLGGTVVARGPTPGLAPIVSIFDEYQREIALVGQWGDDLVFRVRTLAVDLRLRRPAVRLPDAFGTRDTMPVRVEGHLNRHPLSLALSIGSSSRGRDLPMSAQWGWSLLLPFEYAHGAASEPLTALWIVGWMLPIGWWTGRIGHPGFVVVPLLLLLLAGLVALPLAAGLRMASPVEAACAGAALPLGAWRAAALVRRAPAFSFEKR